MFYNPTAGRGPPARTGRLPHMLSVNSRDPRVPWAIIVAVIPNQRGMSAALQGENVSRRQVLGAVSGTLISACHSRTAGPSIEFTRVPKADVGGKEENDIIEGIVKGGREGQRIVLYARSGKWWLQPLRSNPFTRVQNSGKWTNATHLGTEYAALLVNPEYRPAFTYDELPSRGNSVAAVAVVRGQAKPPSITIPFCGYDWRLRSARSSRGGWNDYATANVWTDSGGAMHLRIKKGEKDWTCSEVALTRNFGYGTYRFVVRDISQLEPSQVFTLYTWDYSGAEQGNREMDVEFSRWGDRGNTNARFIVQPYNVAANVSHFPAPAGTLTHTFRWEPGRISFRTVRGSETGDRGSSIAEHVFTSGIPVPGIETVRMNHYVFRSGPPVQQSESEVVVERFEYLP